MEYSIEWQWDPEKDEANRRRHGISLDAARRAFDDPLAKVREDPYVFEQRWRTIGVVGRLLVLVVHTWPELDEHTGALIGRVISARLATPHERRVYEEGLQ